MAHITKEISIKINSRATECSKSQIHIHIQVNGMTTFLMEKERKFFKMVIYMRAATSMGRNKA